MEVLIEECFQLMARRNSSRELRSRLDALLSCVCNAIVSDISSYFVFWKLLNVHVEKYWKIFGKGTSSFLIVLQIVYKGTKAAVDQLHASSNGLNCVFPLPEDSSSGFVHLFLRIVNLKSLKSLDLLLKVLVAVSQSNLKLHLEYFLNSFWRRLQNHHRENFWRFFFVSREEEASSEMIHRLAYHGLLLAHENVHKLDASFAAYGLRSQVTSILKSAWLENSHTKYRSLLISFWLRLMRLNFLYFDCDFIDFLFNERQKSMSLASKDHLLLEKAFKKLVDFFCATENVALLTQSDIQQLCRLSFEYRLHAVCLWSLTLIDLKICEILNLFCENFTFFAECLRLAYSNDLFCRKWAAKIQVEDFVDALLKVIMHTPAIDLVQNAIKVFEIFESINADFAIPIFFLKFCQTSDALDVSNDIWIDFLLLIARCKTKNEDFCSFVFDFLAEDVYKSLVKVENESFVSVNVDHKKFFLMFWAVSTLISIGDKSLKLSHMLFLTDALLNDAQFGFLKGSLRSGIVNTIITKHFVKKTLVQNSVLGYKKLVMKSTIALIYKKYLQINKIVSVINNFANFFKYHEPFEDLAQFWSVFLDVFCACDDSNFSQEFFQFILPFTQNEDICTLICGLLLEKCFFDTLRYKKVFLCLFAVNSPKEAFLFFKNPLISCHNAIFASDEKTNLSPIQTGTNSFPSSLGTDDCIFSVQDLHKIPIIVSRSLMALISPSIFDTVFSFEAIDCAQLIFPDAAQVLADFANFCQSGFLPSECHPYDRVFNLLHFALKYEIPSLLEALKILLLSLMHENNHDSVAFFKRIAFFPAVMPIDATILRQAAVHFYRSRQVLEWAVYLKNCKTISSDEEFLNLSTLAAEYFVF